MVPTVHRVEGALIKWNPSRGFGFIAPTGGGRDLFVHISEFPAGTRVPRVGELLTFEVITTPEGKQRATVVARLGEQVMARAPARRLTGRRSLVGYVAIAAFALLFAVLMVERELPPWVIVLYVGTSIISYVLYAADKAAARDRGWRTPESTLLAFGLIGGWPGAVLAQQILRHKTRKARFQVAFWGTVALNVIALVVFSAAGWLG
ncbi:DUF1294 domain-containing protein [Marisediminicola senii]|uniref:DUF1294 domain-containing protein n=1 Tax=Marisediminicola senii TaxID=2711233 RepID=UPI0013EC174B|nr:cold shock and DUF1294 domain-containing protein [Marisediminicola senii]